MMVRAGDKQIPSSPPAIAPAAWWVGGCRQQVKNILDANGFLQYKRHNILRQFSSIETSRAQKGGGEANCPPGGVLCFFNSEFIFNYKKKLKVERVPAGNRTRIVWVKGQTHNH